MISTKYIVAVIVMSTLLTFFTRAVPFLIWGGNREVPETVKYLGKYLPMAVMGTLIIYCIRSVNVFVAPHGVGEFVSILVVAGTYIFKRNTFLSIGLGTICYMGFMQFIF